MKKKPDVTTRRSQRQQGIEPPSVKLVNRRTKQAIMKQVSPEVTEKQVSPEVTEKQVSPEVTEKQVLPELNEDEVYPDVAGHEEDNLHQSEQDNTECSQARDADNRVDSEEPAAKKRKTRGPTKMRGVAKHIDEKVTVEFTSLGVPVGKGSVTLSSFLGPLVREYVPVLLDDWRHVDEPTRERMWDEIQARFNIDGEWKKDAVFKQMGTLWRASKSRLLTEVKKASRAEIPTLKPSNIQSQTAWKNWVKNKMAEEAQNQSDRFRKLRKAQIPHTLAGKE